MVVRFEKWLVSGWKQQVVRHVCSGKCTLDSGAVQRKREMDARKPPTLRSRFRHYSLSGWLRYLVLRLTGKRLRLEGDCLMCGRCCQRISLEAGGRWLRTQREFEQVLADNPDYARFLPVGSDVQGFMLFTCSWYDRQKGICRDHGNRLSVCRNYPETELYFTGGEMHAGCGYRFRMVASFDEVLEEELRRGQRDRKTNTDR